MKAKDLDKNFDAGEDISGYMDIGKARRPLQATSNDPVERGVDESSKGPRNIAKKISFVTGMEKSSNLLKRAEKKIDPGWSTLDTRQFKLTKTP